MTRDAPDVSTASGMLAAMVERHPDAKWDDDARSGVNWSERLKFAMRASLLFAGAHLVSTEQ